MVNYLDDTLVSSVDFTHEDENVFLGFNASVFETLKDDFNDKYEYIIPEITLDKNLLSDENYGNLDLLSNYKVRNYDTNKVTNFLINELNWTSKEFIHVSGIKSKFLEILRI